MTLTIFNSYHKRLQFTYEIENNNCLHFFNGFVIKNNDGNISTSWFRKKSFSGRFLSYFLSHPLHKKIGIIENLVDSAILLSDKKIHQDNLKLAFTSLNSNGYPCQFINRHIRKRLNEINSKLKHHNNDLNITLNDSTNKNVSVVSIPYYGNLSEIVKRFLRKYNVKVVFRINSKLDRFIVLGKDPYEIGEQNNVVYKISCSCGKGYVGQTKRPLRIRIDEHFKNFNLDEKFHNVISKHRKKYEDIKKESDNSLSRITDILLLLII